MKKFVFWVFDAFAKEAAQQSIKAAIKLITNLLS
jgi:hypothetical protein